MEFFSKTPNFDFLGKRWFFYILSVVLIAGTGSLWFAQGDSKYGVDFVGGHEFVVRVDGGGDQDATSESIRKALGAGGFDGAVVQAFEPGSRQFSIRFRTEGETTTLKEKITEVLRPASPNGIEILRTEFVGPTIGAELRQKALVAITLGLAGILIYLSIRFEFAFAFGAVVAVFHDVIVSLGAYLLASFPINMATVAAALTIVGYSVNDTIVIFDRVREELMKTKGEPLSTIVNRSINVTLSRTLITQFLTFLSVAALLFLGGGAIRDLSLFLFAGMITGTYSTIYIASPVMIAWHKFRGGTEDVS